MTRIKRKRGYESKKAWVGFFFILPWVIGALFFFIKPAIESILYSFSEIKILENGYRLDFVGFELYLKAFTKDPDFLRKLTETLPPMLYQVPIVLILSLFLAILINQKFFGRVIVRACFFLPVIIASGVIISIIRGDALSQQIMQNVSSSQLFKADWFRIFLLESGVGDQVVSFITRMVDSIFELVWKSGIQILIFLAGLQTIPPQMYEAAEIEGGTSWEIFWKVTVPMLSPMILLNLIYTIIDNFTDYSNAVMAYVNAYSAQVQLEYSSALAWIYFLFVLIIVGTVYLIVNRKMHSEM